MNLTSASTMNVDAVDYNDASKTLRIENFVQSLFDYVSYQESSMSGKFYNFNEGYVVVSTITPFRVNKGDMNPTSGELRISGTSNSSARMIVNATGYTVSTDEDGDGTYETSTAGAW
ncbi:hypothetical protein ACFLZI_01260 [Nitrospirota bacterium]